MAAIYKRTDDRAFTKPSGQEASYEASTPTVTESYATFFQRGRGSISASSDSTNSSPTTAPLSNSETPGTSPDTPSQSYSYPSLSSALKGTADSRTEQLPPLAPSPRKPRNLKSLAVNTSSASQFGRSLSSASLPVDTGFNPPMSPSVPPGSAFVKPSNLSRRKTSGLNLTIKTPAVDLAGEEPATPIQSALNGPHSFQLRRAQTMVSMPLPSARLGPGVGMRLPTFAPPAAKAPSEEDESDEASLGNYDAPESREAPPAAYPNGPVCIYDPQIYLYLEPSAEEAAEYDVILNVANEVVNPFSKLDHTRHVPSKSLKAAAEALDHVRTSQNGPEYIHVPWEHNTDIVPDLYDLVKVVDDRVQSGKRVLIHCQCGVSRSASLIVAYGLYKNPAMSVQQAYDAVKAKSQWIGPNMNLIMQLQEFRNGLIKSDLNNRDSRLQIGRKNRGVTISNDALSPERRIPQTAPLAQTNSRNAPTPINTSNLDDVPPGPASAPCDLNVSGESTITAASAQPQPKEKTEPEKVSPKKHSRQAPPTLNLGLASNKRLDQESMGFTMAPVFQNDDDLSFGITSPRDERFAVVTQSMFTEPLATPRSTEFGMTALRQSDVGDTFTMGLTSPRDPTTGTIGGQIPQRFAPASSRLASSKTERRPSSSSKPQPISNSRSTTSTSSKYSTSSSSKHSPSTSSKPSSSSTSKSSSSKPSSSTHRRPAKLPISTTTSSLAESALFSPRTTEFPGHPMNMNDAFAPRPRSEAFIPEDIMSPRATEFTDNPIHDALAGGSRPRSSTTPKAGAKADPRSPPSRGANPITRDIFDVL